MLHASPEKIVYRFLPGDAKPEQTITYLALDQRARALAARILERAKCGDRVLILVPPGLDYIAAYFACLYAGVIAVPAYPPNPRRPDPRIPSIVRDCGPTAALTTTGLLSRFDKWRGDDSVLARLEWIAADDPALRAAPSWTAPAVGAVDVVFHAVVVETAVGKAVHGEDVAARFGQPRLELGQFFRLHQVDTRQIS